MSELLAPLSQPSLILWPLAGHLFLVLALYGWLTLERFVRIVVRGKGEYGELVTPGGDTGRAARVAANLSNQFEAPTLFHPLVLVLFATGTASGLDLAFAWLFLAGRLIHTLVQSLTANVPVRGLVFSINFAALAGLWMFFLARAFGLLGGLSFAPDF